jgi:hypothetical protein
MATETGDGGLTDFITRSKDYPPKKSVDDGSHSGSAVRIHETDPQ